MEKFTNPNVSGQAVIKALKHIGQPATLQKICRHIAQNEGIDVESVKNSIKLILRGGFKFGFIKRRGYSYYVDGLEPQTNTKLGMTHGKLKQVTNYAFKNKGTKSNGYTFGKAKPLNKPARVVKKKLMKPKKKTTKQQVKSQTVKNYEEQDAKLKETKENMAPNQSDSKLKSASILENKVGPTNVHNMPAVKSSDPESKSTKESASEWNNPKELMNFWSQKLKELCDEPKTATALRPVADGNDNNTFTLNKSGNDITESDENKSPKAFEGNFEVASNNIDGSTSHGNALEMTKIINLDQGNVGSKNNCGEHKIVPKRAGSELNSAEIGQTKKFKVFEEETCSKTARSMRALKRSEYNSKEHIKALSLRAAKMPSSNSRTTSSKMKPPFFKTKQELMNFWSQKLKELYDESKTARASGSVPDAKKVNKCTLEKNGESKIVKTTEKIFKKESNKIDGSTTSDENKSTKAFEGNFEVASNNIDGLTACHGDGTELEMTKIINLHQGNVETKRDNEENKAVPKRAGGNLNSAEIGQTKKCKVLEKKTCSETARFMRASKHYRYNYEEYMRALSLRAAKKFKSSKISPSFFKTKQELMNFCSQKLKELRECKTATTLRSVPDAVKKTKHTPNEEGNKITDSGENKFAKTSEEIFKMASNNIDGSTNSQGDGRALENIENLDQTNVEIKSDCEKKNVVPKRSGGKINLMDNKKQKYSKKTQSCGKTKQELMNFWSQKLRELSDESKIATNLRSDPHVQKESKSETTQNDGEENLVTHDNDLAKSSKKPEEVPTDNIQSPEISNVDETVVIIKSEAESKRDGDECKSGAQGSDGDSKDCMEDGGASTE